MELSISLSYPYETSSYDNSGAHETTKTIMQRDEEMNIEFGTDRSNYPCAFIESKSFKQYKVRLNQSYLTYLFNYLQTGEKEDFGVNPEAVEPFKESDDTNFRLKMFKQLVESGKQLQFVPLFRSSNGYLTAFANYKKGGIITFRLKRTEELIDYLREKGQI